MSEWEGIARSLMEQRYRALVGYARMVAGSSVNAEDLVQEALIKTFSRPRGLANVTVAETARTLGLADGSVKRYVSDGIATLNRLLGTTDEAEEQQFVRVQEGGSR